VDIKWIRRDSGWHTFHMLADGNRPVLAMFVNENDPELVIWVGDPRLAHLIKETWTGAQQTLGRAHTHPKIDESGVTTIVCIGSIASYVLPRIATLMARVYLPADAEIQP